VDGSLAHAGAGPRHLQQQRSYRARGLAPPGSTARVGPAPPTRWAC
jgi:hypothetical protein